MADKRDNFLINLNNCKNEINYKFKQISDKLLIRQNQLLSELEQVENKYLEDTEDTIQDEIQKLENVKKTQKNSLEDAFNILQENVITCMKDAIEKLEVQIAEHRKKLVAFTNIDIELDTDSINILIDKLGSVILTEDSEYNLRVDYITDMCDIDPCESYSPFNKNNNNNDIVCTDALANKKREQGNVMSNISPIKDVDIVPEAGIPDSVKENVRPIGNYFNPKCTAALHNKKTIRKSSSYMQSMVQHNTPFNLNKNECPVDSSPRRSVMYRSKSNSTLPGSATQLNNEVNSKHQSAYFDQFSKQTPDVNIIPRSKTVYSKYHTQDVNNTIPKTGIPDSQIQFNLNENVHPIDSYGNPESTAALSNRNTIHNAETDTPVIQVKGRNKRKSILLPDIYYAAGAEVAAPDQDVDYHRSMLESSPGNAACRNIIKQKNSEDTKRENLKFETFGKNNSTSPQGASTDLDDLDYCKHIYNNEVSSKVPIDKILHRKPRSASMTCLKNKDSPQLSSQNENREDLTATYTSGYPNRYADSNNNTVTSSTKNFARSNSEQSSKTSQRSADTYSLTKSTTKNRKKINKNPFKWPKVIFM